MRSWPLLLLAALAPVPAPGQNAAAPAQESVTIFRCVDARGVVSLQDKPCAQGSEGTSREMVRPKDAPPRPVVERTPEPEPEPDEVEYVPLRIPPPPMFVCTSYDGIVRESEVYDPNPRCEPLVLYYPEPQRLPRSYQRSCQWVQDSCVRLSDEAACERWRKRLKVARSDVLHADYKSQPYRKSELARISGIVRDHCD
jgi:hypothetical protein